MTRSPDSTSRRDRSANPAPKMRLKPMSLSKTGDYRFENDPRFLRRIEEARKNVAASRGTKLEDL